MKENLFKDSREFHSFCKYLKKEVNKWFDKETDEPPVMEISLDTIKEIVLRYMPNEIDIN